MRPRFIILFLVAILALNACGGNQSGGTETPVPTDTPIVPPTATVPPAIPLAILVVPAELDPETSNLYQKTVYDLAQASGLRFQVRNHLTAPDLAEPGLQVVIVFPPDPGILELAATAPQVQFLAVNLPEVTPGGNISVLGSSSQSDTAAFLAGYTAALTTTDYRIGMMLPRDNQDAVRAFNAYSAGMHFQCGSCPPVYVYPGPFPQYVAIPPEEDPANYHAYADILLLQYKVLTIYLYPDIVTPELINYIASTGASMIGTVSPDPRPGGWMMTIQPDIIKGIQTAWPGLISGQGGVIVQSPIGLADIDPNLLSPGRQRLVEQTLDELLAGRINIVANP